MDSLDAQAKARVVQAQLANNSSLTKVKQKMQRINKRRRGLSALLTMFILLMTTNYATGFYRSFITEVSMLKINLLLLGLLLVFGFRIFNPPSLAKLYRKHFFKPTFNLIFPKASILYTDTGNDATDEQETLTTITPYARKYAIIYESNCYIQFGDVWQTKFCNLHAMIKGFQGRNTTAFWGQVFKRTLPTPPQGKLRLVPKNYFLGRERQGGHPKAVANEIKIELQNRTFNDHYNVYCSDEQTARNLLSPPIQSELVRWATVCPIYLVIEGSSLILSFYTGQFVFQTPK
ncbi:DUF3137 domain-containing protein, partial [Actinotignum sp. GS-2025c]